MELDIKDRLFIVCGATSGFGNAVTRRLILEGARVIGIARRREMLENLESEQGKSLEILQADVTSESFLALLTDQINGRKTDGVVVNASGPPALPFAETTMEDWDQAYRQLLRWKVGLTRLLLPHFMKNNYGRFVYIESSSIKQPIETMILSTSLRLAVAGFAKTISQEIPDKGITFNVLAPGYHHTPAVDRIAQKKSQLSGIPEEEALKQLVGGIPMKKMGDPDQFATLALWLLSPLSAYVTGQVFAVDGGMVRSIL